MKYILTFFIPLLLLSCTNENPAEHTEAGTHSHDQQNEESNFTTLTQQQIQSIGLTLGNIEQKQLTASLRANGILKVPNQNKASINSLYRGVVRSLLIQPGSRVKKGEVLATIANPDFIQIQDEYLGLDSRIHFAQQEFDRQKELNAGNAGALKNLQAAESQLKTFNLRKSTLSQQIRLMGIDPLKLNSGNLSSVVAVRSPIEGVVSDVAIQIGTYIDLNTRIATVVDNRHLHVDLFIFEKDLPQLKTNQIIHFTLTNNAGQEYDARIFSLGSSFEGESKAVSVHAEVEGDKTGLIDGMSITALISLKEETVPALPSEAIVRSQGQDYIFIQSADSAAHTEGSEVKFERVAIVGGTSYLGFTEVKALSDIPSDARVVVKGAFFIMSKLDSGNTGHDHH